ncbi:hypothetical protein GQ53DRAFT_661004 [Thozetella sp. PMI_491]|nr:hypothetical protein GQ53DRAFT_661004 [Thozetella sp. PMI_491]
MAIEKHAGGPGSSSRAWDLSELTKCGAINTTCQGSFNLDGEIHPIFNLWEFPDDNDAGVVESLVAELDQPLLLASRILETAGLPWLSELLIRDIHDASYPGRTVAEEIFRHPADSSVGESAKTPDIIVRHFDNPGIPPSLQRRWLRATSYKLQTELPKQIVWHLDGTIFDTNGWVGYTCRHPRRGNHNEGQVLSVPELDRKETIEACDAQGKAEGASGRSLTVLVMRQYAARLMHLRKLGRFGGEEYILTAFMAAVTLLHELGHAAYWRDFRAKNARMTEPYFGGDLEMELGDSFVAHIFGGWVPVPIASQEQLLAEGITFKDGLAWRQHLTRDLHKTRPRYRAHYSVQVKQYVPSRHLLTQLVFL